MDEIEINRFFSQNDNTENIVDEGLRPSALSSFVGQEKIKEKLDIYIQSARLRNEPLDHLLFYGPPGLGKTTLAGIIANEMGGQLRVTTGPALEKAGDLASIISNLEFNDVLFIDEIHRMPAQVEEILYPAMEDFCLHIVTGKGPTSKNIKITLPKFTLVGATTRFGLLTSPLRARFGIVEQLALYSNDEISKIIKRAGEIMKIGIDKQSADEMAKCSRGTPRIALRLLRRTRDVAEVQKEKKINLSITKRTMEMLEIDELGLDSGDRKILTSIIDMFSGGPVGLSTMASALNEDEQTIEDIYEPYLIQKGFLEKTPRGRKATIHAYKYLGKTPTNMTRSLFD